MEHFQAWKEKLSKPFPDEQTEEKILEGLSKELAEAFDVRVPELILDRTFVVIDQSRCLSHDSCMQQVSEHTSYDADDEGLEEAYIFPCHLNFNNCHPELLSNYHPERIQPARTSIIKFPKICEFVVDYIFDALKTKIQTTRSKRTTSLSSSISDDTTDSLDEDAISEYFNSVIAVIKKLTKICTIESINVRIIARTNILETLMGNIRFLISEIPSMQRMYLDILFKFALILADYKITGNVLKQIFNIIKDENTDLKIVLENFERLLNHHYKNMRNIQPLKSINFPAASKTAEEIELDYYVANSCQWRLRSGVIEHKRKMSRSRDPMPNPSNDGRGSSSKKSDLITSSWLECSMMTPLSNIAPLVHNGKVKFCCSMWTSVCGDLLVIDNMKPKKSGTTRDFFRSIDWQSSRGHWVRLASRKQLVQRFKKKNCIERARPRRLSLKLKARQVHDKEDEEKEEKEEKDRRSDYELSQGTSGSGFKLFKNPAIYKPYRATRITKSATKIKPGISTQIYIFKESRRTSVDESRDVSQELLMHLISFAIGLLTIEFWLNVKSMTFCIRACRLVRDSQPVLIDQKIIPSHLIADGSWSNLIFCLEECSSSSGLNSKMSITLVTNGIHEEKRELTYKAHKSPPSNFACLLGCERSAFGYVWKLSQMNIYKNIPDDRLPIYLLGKGPDFWCFTNFNQQSTLTLPDITQRFVKHMMNKKVLYRYGTIDEDLALNWITQNIVIAYVAHQPDYFLDYTTRMASTSILGTLPTHYELSNIAERFIQAKTLDFTRAMKFNTNNSFGTALVEAGGIESVLICFSEVIRRSLETADTHSLSFSILLKMSQTNQYHLVKFLDELNGLKLSEFILCHPDCLVSEHMLRNYFNFCVVKHGHHRLIKSSRLIYHLLTCWKAWHKDIRVAKSFYRRLIQLVKSPDSLQTRPGESHVLPHHVTYNLEMLTSAGGIDILMGVLRECLVPLDQNNPCINHELIKLIIDLIWQLIRNPPGLDVMLDIMEFLFFLHPDAKAFVEDDYKRLSFLRKLEDDSQERVAMNNVSYNGVKTPSTEDSLSSRESLENLSHARDNQNSDYETDYQNSNDRSARIDKQLENEFLRFRDTISEESERFIDASNSHSNFKSKNEQKNLWLSNDITNYTSSDIRINKQSKNDVHECSDLNYAIGNIANMLASIVRLTSTDQVGILAESLQKQIIDSRKIVILANNESSFVRENILQLFLYCIQSCYLLNLDQTLAKYEQEVKGTNYKTCIPIQLIARQLLKYPTTVGMIKLCYGVIVGIDLRHSFEMEGSNFETKFDKENVNTNLKVNVLTLLIQLMNSLQKPQEVIAALKFVHAYIKYLLDMGEENTVDYLIKNYLNESLMKMYFFHVELIINDSRDLKHYIKFDEVGQELDRLLLLVARHYLQNLSTNEAFDSLEELLLYFSLMNDHIPSRYHYILRDRCVRILSTTLRYCQHYENSARQQVHGDKLMDYLKSIPLPFKSNEVCTFPNVLSESDLELEMTPSDNFEKESTLTPKSQGNGCSKRQSIDDGVALQNGHGLADDSSEYDNPHINYNEDEAYDTSEIDEANVIERFKATFRLVVAFLRIRKSDVIPSPKERCFVIKVIQMLSSYLIDYRSLNKKNKNFLNGFNTRSNWSRMLPKIEKSARSSFTLLILYLLSPSDSMNLDERKYYAAKLLETFSTETLLDLLDDDKTKYTYKLLLVFTKELIEYNSSVFGSEDSHSERSDNMFEDEIEIKLRSLVQQLDSRIGFESPSKFNGLPLSASTLLSNNFLDATAQIREKYQDKSLKLVTPVAIGSNNYTSIENINVEASEITRDVTKDKNGQRKTYLEDLKQTKFYNYHIRQQWLSLIIGHSHERAIWFMDNYYPKSWELNPVEGPSRCRRRLRPCKLTLEERFLRKTDQNSGQQKFAEGDSFAHLNHIIKTSSQGELYAVEWYNQYSPHPLCSMVINNEQVKGHNELRNRMFTYDKIHFNCCCSIVRPNEVCEGEISIASWCIHFIGERSDTYQLHVNDCFVQSHTFREASQSVSGTRCEVKGSLATTTLSERDSSKMRLDRSITQTRKAFVSSIVEDLWFDEIVEIWDRRYQLQEIGLEIFLTNNMTYLISFRSNRDREEFKKYLLKEQHKMINLQRFNISTSLNKISQLWREGKITNFDYLTCLNKLAGRSFNDLMQYPVFPFVLSNYTSDTLNLNDQSNFRRLERPMAIQNEERKKNFINNYRLSLNSSLTVGPSGLNKPYHYSNHYSNSATVLHFLVRLPPFTQMLIQYQDNNFDQPDRTFHSIANTWQLITKDSNTDFKELIPEFFFLPEMFMNLGQFELGMKQSNELVDNVRLPPWCPREDARLFTLIHRQALESSYVSENLHNWIDLIFGYKQTGKAAVEAINVYHPATYYEGVDLSKKQSPTNVSSNPLNSTIASLSPRSSTYGSEYVFKEIASGSSTKNSSTNQVRIQADIERSALETMIKTYGQMPRQLFNQPVKQRFANTYTNVQIIPKPQADENINTGKPREPLAQVKGLKWGSYVGSLDEDEIFAVKHKWLVPEEQSKTISERRAMQGSMKVEPSKRFQLCLLTNGDVVFLRENTSLMLDYRADRKPATSYVLTLPSVRFSRRAGLSNMARLNLFSNMIISRQQFSFLEPAYSSSSQLNSLSGTNTLVSKGGSRAKFTTESLSLVSWFYLDGTIRVRHPATDDQKPSVPLVHANTIVDSMSTCTSVPELNLLLVGYSSGSICAHIVSTAYETAPVKDYLVSNASKAAADASATNSAGPAAVHFLHVSTSSSSQSVEPFGPGKLSTKSGTGEPYSPISLAGKTVHSIKRMNKTSRWLYCHSKRVNTIKINVSFGIVVTGSDDGTSVIWDLNSLTYVRTIDYKYSSLRKPSGSMNNETTESRPCSPASMSYHRLADFLCNCNESAKPSEDPRPTCFRNTKQCSICNSGVSLIAVSDTLGDIATVKEISNRLGQATGFEENSSSRMSNKSTVPSSSSQDDNSKSSILYVHTINGELVNFVNCHTQISAVCYSNAPEGISVNVIVVGLINGLVRMYSSWDLSRVKEFCISGFNASIHSLLYSRDNQHLYVTDEGGQLVVLCSKKRGSIAFPKEWYL